MISIIANLYTNKFSAKSIMRAVDMVVKADPNTDGPMWRTAWRVLDSLFTSPGNEV